MVASNLIRTQILHSHSSHLHFFLAACTLTSSAARCLHSLRTCTSSAATSPALSLQVRPEACTLSASVCIKCTVVRELPRKRALTVRPLDGVHAVLLAAAEPLRGGQRSDTRLEVHRATEHLLRVAAAFKIHCARGPRRRVRERAGGMGRARAAHPSCLDLSGTARHESPMT